MARFRVRPVEVDAVQWTGDNHTDLQAFVGNSVTVQPDGQAMFWAPGGYTMWAPRGSWLVAGEGATQAGGFAVMTDGEFTGYYEPAGG